MDFFIGVWWISFEYLIDLPCTVEFSINNSFKATRKFVVKEFKYKRAYF